MKLPTTRDTATASPGLKKWRGRALMTVDEWRRGALPCSAGARLDVIERAFVFSGGRVTVSRAPARRSNGQPHRPLGASNMNSAGRGRRALRGAVVRGGVAKRAAARPSLAVRQAVKVVAAASHRHLGVTAHPRFAGDPAGVRPPTLNFNRFGAMICAQAVLTMVATR